MVYLRLAPSLVSKLLLLSFVLVGFAVHSQGRKNKAVFILIDGISGDVMQKLELPAVKQIAEAGGFTLAHVGGNKGAYNETPTISAPGYMNLITGTWGNKHNVWDNKISNPNYQYKSIFRMVKEYDPTLKTGVFSTWQDNRTKLIGEGLSATGMTQIDFKLDGLELDKARFPHDNASNYIHLIDEAVTAEAARVIKTEGPDLSWVYLEFTDDMGHRYGDSPQFNEAIQTADRQIDKIWQVIQWREKTYNEKWLIVITTDHGRNAANGKNHGGQSDRERLTWIVTNGGPLNSRFDERPGIVDILPSILNHLGIPVSEETAKELDGIPFLGTIDLTGVQAMKEGNKITVSWKNKNPDPASQAEIWISETNHFKTGGQDAYRKIAQVAISKESATFIGSGPYYKIVVKAPHHSANTWISK